MILLRFFPRIFPCCILRNNINHDDSKTVFTTNFTDPGPDSSVSTPFSNTTPTISSNVGMSMTSSLMTLKSSPLLKFSAKELFSTARRGLEFNTYPRKYMFAMGIQTKARIRTKGGLPNLRLFLAIFITVLASCSVLLDPAKLSKSFVEK